MLSYIQNNVYFHAAYDFFLSLKYYYMYYFSIFPLLSDYQLNDDDDDRRLFQSLNPMDGHDQMSKPSTSRGQIMEHKDPEVTGNFY